MAKFTDQLQAFCELATGLARSHNASALLFLLERPTDLKRLRKAVEIERVVVASVLEEVLEGAAEDGIATIKLNLREVPVYEQLTEALIDGAAHELFTPEAILVAAYSAFESGVVDTMSLIRLEEHLGRLTVRDLRQIRTKLPIETLKLVVDLAVEIGREGREGKPVGSLFVVGDHRKVLTYCHAMGFDPVKGYNRNERSLADQKVREGVKEIAQMDGAFVVASDGTVVAAAQHISAPSVPEMNLAKGLGARHWSAAEITKATGAIAIAVSESNGTVRVFQDGEVKLRIEPFRRAMKWKAFDLDSP